MTGPEPTDLPVPHVIVFDGNPDALERRHAAVAAVDPSIPIVGTASRTAALLLASAAPAGALVLVDLFATDRVSLDRPGERLLRRLARTPETAHVRAMAWSAQLAADVVRGVRTAGARGFIAASVDRDREQAALREALAGRTVWPDSEGATPGRIEAAWQTWFEERFGIAWESWVEPTLARLASGRERSAVAGELVEAGVAKSPGHAAARMRDLAHAVAGEHRNSAVTVAAAASLTLSQIASHRPLGEQPTVAVSLEQGARAARTAPSLLRAAGLTADEIDEIVEIDSLIVAKRSSAGSRVGAPPADSARSERLWAAGRRASMQGAGREQIDEIVAGMLTRLDEALIALDDARQDELYHPEARAAAALSLLRPADGAALAAAGITGVEFAGTEASWSRRRPDQLAVAADLPVEQLRRFTAEADAAILRRPTI